MFYIKSFQNNRKNISCVSQTALWLFGSDFRSHFNKMSAQLSKELVWPKLVSMSFLLCSGDLALTIMLSNLTKQRLGNLKNYINFIERHIKYCYIIWFNLLAVMLCLFVYSSVKRRSLLLPKSADWSNTGTQQTQQKWCWTIQNVNLFIF